MLLKMTLLKVEPLYRSQDCFAYAQDSILNASDSSYKPRSRDIPVLL